MKNGKQFILSLFFGAILVLPILAIGILQLAQACIKSSREERLKKEELVQVILPAKQFTWEEEGKELWVGDRMFDVASYFTKDGNYYLTGVYDDDETKVAGSLLHSFVSNKGNDLLQLILLLQCFAGSLLFIYLANKYRHSPKQSALYLFQLPHPFILILGPPPRN